MRLLGLELAVSCATERQVEPDTCPERTVVVFDCDDTLCLTFAMKDLGITPRGPALLSPGTHSCGSEPLDSCLAVFNQGEGWVQSRARHGCLTCHHRSDSASSRWRPLGIASKRGWKDRTSSEILSGPHLGGSWTNASSVGDSECKCLALLEVMRSRPTSQLETCRTKIVKFDHKHSTKRFLRQLRQVTSGLQQLIEHEGDLDLKLDPRWLRVQDHQMGGEWNTTCLVWSCTKRTS